MPADKPNPEAFAKHVLWYLCGVQAQLGEIEAHLVNNLSRGDPAKIEILTAESKARRLKVQNDLFADAVKQSGLDAGESNSPHEPRT